jgi:hypothetical protein
MRSLTDEKLMVLCQNDNHAAFTELRTRHPPRILGRIRNILYSIAAVTAANNRRRANATGTYCDPTLPPTQPSQAGNVRKLDRGERPFRSTTARRR